MAKRLSRRQILGIGAGSLAAGAAWTEDGHGERATTNRPRRQPTSQWPRRTGKRAYSGGPIDVAPLAPGLPGEHYKPVVVPNGAALPFKVVDGVKVFHVIAEEVDHAFDSGLRAKCWGYNGRVNSTVIEAVEGERVRIYVTNRLPVATSDPLAWDLSPQRHGRRRRADAAVHQGRRDGEVRVDAAAARELHVPLPSRRDDADGDGADRHVHRPPAEPVARLSRGPRLLAHDQRVVGEGGDRAPEHARDDGLQRPDDQRQGVSLDGAAGLQDRRSGQAAPGQPGRHGPSPDAHPRASLPRSPRPTARTSRCRRSGRRRPCWSRWGRRATSSSSPMLPGTGHFTAT